MTTLGVVFAIVIVAVVAAFTAIWFSTMKGMQDTNAQLLEAALKKATAEPQPVVVQPPQPSAAETAKAVADAVARAQSEQSAVFAKTLEGLNASLDAMRKDNAEMKAEIERGKAAAEKAEADRVAAEKAAAEKAAAEKAAAEKAAAERAAAAKAAAEKPAAEKAATSAPQTTPTTQTAAKRPAEAKQAPAPLQVPKYDAPPPPEGFSQDAMGIRLPKEPRPVSWRIYVPTRVDE